MDIRQMKKIAIRRFSGGAIFFGLLFFLTAGTIRYWQAWAYMVVLFGSMIFMVRYFFRNDPELLERRLKMKEERETQSTLQKVGVVFWIAVFVIPGLDQRFEWSSVPWTVVIASDVMVLVGYLFICRVFMENSYASRIIEVHEGQGVITTGPYALVRHPMYSAVLVLMLFTPLALGSFWAVIPTLMLPLQLFLRIRDEEEMLLEELEGYREYTEQIRYRLIPGIW
jgi:protein-S-isoprenylcysteine O-methyltransferase Ste14